MLRAISKSGIPWFRAAAVIGIAGCSPGAQGQQTIVLTPAHNLEAIVAHAPEGTRFLFEPGMYRQQTIRPKN